MSAFPFSVENSSQEYPSRSKFSSNYCSKFSSVS